MNRLFISTILFFSSFVCLSAQIEKPYFQVFDIGDDIKSIKIETIDSFTVRKWNGVQLMLDMAIHLEGGTMDLLGMAIFDNRYAFEVEKQGNNALFRSKLTRRDITKLKYQGNLCTEKVVMTIYLPEGFDIINATEFVRKSDVLIAAEKR
jgi:hypothetical protein